MTEINSAINPDGWEWLEDETGTLNFINADGIMLGWIFKRPQYCDRGHWQFNCEVVPSLDYADSFPRYYMDLDTAKREGEEWLRWRLYKETKHQ